MSIRHLKNILTLIIGLLSCQLSLAQVYVNINAAGANDGTSWEHAFTGLQDALNASNEGDQVWVATGTYLPGKPDDPNSSTFHVTKDIQLYGGFSGTESSVSERTPTNFQTILSGDLNQDDVPGDFKINRSDNVNTIMLVENQDLNIPVIDGFIFEGGQADGDENTLYQKDGGGLYSFGPIEIRHCIFRNNYASRYGGAMVFDDSLLISSPTKRNKFRARNHQMIIDSCYFENNFSEVCGGALYNYLEDEKPSKIYIGHSKFNNNKCIIAGGAIYNELASSDSRLQIEYCSFENNEGEVGGAILNSIRYSNVRVDISDCNFSQNKSLDDFPDILTSGGALRFSVQQESKGFSAEVSRCSFYNNSTLSQGGGISAVVHRRSESTKIAIDSCKFENNEAGAGGGLAFSLGGKNDSILIKTCTFQNNSSTGQGGGAIAILPHNAFSFSTIRDCSFSGNQAIREGSSFYFSGKESDYKLENCTFNVRQAKEGQDLFNTKPSFAPYMLFLFIQGALWLQILYNLLMFLMIRERTTLYFVLFMVSLSMLYFVLNDAAYFPFVQESFLSAEFVIVFSQLSVVGIVLSFIKFAQHYLNINQFYPLFKKFIFYYIILFLIIDLIWISALLVGFYQQSSYWERQTNIIYQIAVFIGFSIPFIGAIMVARKGFKPAKLLLPALFLIFIGSIYLLFAYSFSSTNEMNFLISQGFTLLALIAIALANGYRTNLLKKDKERAERLAELDIAKTRLYTNITHEFRTPLTVIMGASDLVKGNEPEKELIKRNSKQLLQLINQMLDLSNLEGGALKLQAQQGNIIPFTEYLVESFQSMADSKNVRLTFYRELDELNMDYDAEKMQQIISNLLSNAIKFTGASGKVIVHAKEELFNGKPYLTLAVRDNGKGIPEENIPHVFDRFFQVDDSDVRHSEGSGIGLALVKELVELMNGQIEVSSKVGDGTVFTVRIPISKVAPIQSQGIKQNKLLLPSDSPNQKESALPFQPLADDLPLALIIEDNKDIVSFLRSCLQRQYKIEVAYNGREGIDKALDIIPDIIISDVMMPEADGYTVCKTLKEDERTSHVPIILLTAKATQEDKVHGLDVGADAYLSKPFHQQELEVRLQKLIELRKQLQQRYQNASTGSQTSENKEDLFIQKLRSTIEENMEDESFGIAELCRKVGLSRMQVHRKLKALTGMPTSQFLHTLRLQKAYQLLQSTDLNVSEVAYKVGFSDPSYFTKLFVKQFGKTPSEV